MGKYSHIHWCYFTAVKIFSQPNDDFIIPQWGDEVETEWFCVLSSPLIGNTIVMTSKKENVFDILHYGHNIFSDGRETNHYTCWNLCGQRLF